MKCRGRKLPRRWYLIYLTLSSIMQASKKILALRVTACLWCWIHWHPLIEENPNLGLGDNDETDSVTDRGDNQMYVVRLRASCDDQAVTWTGKKNDRENAGIKKANVGWWHNLMTISSTSHIRQHSLSKMPPKKFIRGWPWGLLRNRSPRNLPAILSS